MNFQTSSLQSLDWISRFLKHARSSEQLKFDKRIKTDFSPFNIFFQLSFRHFNGTGSKNFISNISNIWTVCFWYEKSMEMYCYTAGIQSKAQVRWSIPMGGTVPCFILMFTYIFSSLYIYRFLQPSLLLHMKIALVEMIEVG